MDLKELLESSIKKKIDEEVSDQKGVLSSSNALLWDDLNFQSEDSDHCPRIALMRRVGNIQEDKTIESYISNTHGRTFEEFFRNLLLLNKDIKFMEEEEVQVHIEDSEANKLLTGRPDKILLYNKEMYPIETKTIQSSTTAYKVFIKEKPKLGALIQLASYMYGHQLTKGFLVYCASNWFSGFSGRTQWKVKPSFKVFEVELKEDSFLYYNGQKSAVSIKKLISGSYRFLRFKDKNILPNRPQWIDVNGDLAQYVGCTYCFAKDICDVYGQAHNHDLNLFFNSVKEKLNESK